MGSVKIDVEMNTYYFSHVAAYQISAHIQEGTNHS